MTMAKSGKSVRKRTKNGSKVENKSGKNGQNRAKKVKIFQCGSKVANKSVRNQWQEWVKKGDDGQTRQKMGLKMAKKEVTEISKKWL